MSSARSQIPFIDLKAQYAALASEIDAAIDAVIGRCDFILGSDVRLFEEEFAAFCEAHYAVGVDSGTSALELALLGYGVGPGDEVITAANTFIATALAVSHTGATPVLVDVDPYTYTIDVGEVEQAITERTKVIIPVHLYGQPADMDPIVALARRRNLIVIEDACQAHGARYRGRRAGSLANAAAFSFYPGKNLGAYGDGGMIVTSDPVLVERLHRLRNYGQSRKYVHESRGFNRRLDTMQAAILRVKLKHLDEWNAARRQHARKYTELLAGNSIITPIEANYAESVWHQYVIRTRDRDGLQQYLTAQGIPTIIHYPIPIHLQAAYADLNLPPGTFERTERFADEILSLPIFPEMTLDTITYIVDAIHAFVHDRQGQLTTP